MKPNRQRFFLVLSVLFLALLVFGCVKPKPDPKRVQTGGSGSLLYSLHVETDIYRQVEVQSTPQAINATTENAVTQEAIEAEDEREAIQPETTWVWKKVEVEEEQTDDIQVEEIGTDGEEQASEHAVMPTEEPTCLQEEDPCECIGDFYGEAAIIFIPEQPMKIVWMNRRGWPGHYANGTLVQDGEDWRYGGPVPGELGGCEVSKMTWDFMQRLTELELTCRWENTEYECRGEDQIELKVSEPQDIKPEVKELPWTTELEGTVIRYGDEQLREPLPAFTTETETDSEQ